MTRCRLTAADGEATTKGSPSPSRGRVPALLLCLCCIDLSSRCQMHGLLTLCAIVLQKKSKQHGLMAVLFLFIDPLPLRSLALIDRVDAGAQIATDISLSVAFLPFHGSKLGIVEKDISNPIQSNPRDKNPSSHEIWFRTPSYLLLSFIAFVQSTLAKFI
jgi:hypothetical protein